MNILIVGCGDVGCALGFLLSKAGHTAVGLRRHPPGGYSGIITWHAADLVASPDTALLPALDIDAVCFTAAPDQGSDQTYAQIYVQGTRRILNALARRGDSLKRVLFASSTGVFAQDDGQWIDETSITLPQSYSGKRMLEAEALIQQTPQGICVRFAGIYGPGRMRLIERALAPEPEVPQNPFAFTNRIHVEDCAGILAHLLFLKDPESLYIGVDHAPASWLEVVNWMREVKHLPTLKIKARSLQASQGKRCSNQRIQSTGYQLKWPTYREGYAPLLDHFSL